MIMKKAWMNLVLLICLFTLSSSKNQKDSTISNFIKTYNINYDDLKPYLSYKDFKLEDYFSIELMRIRNNYQHIEAINYYYHRKIEPAKFKDTYLILVNKNFYLTKDYVPNNLINIPEISIKHANKNIMLQSIVIEAYIKMITELELSNLYIFSGYRDYYKQEALYNYYQDDNYSAKPGFSEHQTGLAIDISKKDIGLTDFFKDTTEYKILINNCHKYGFILRYPENKQDKTGYYFEPWHFRYVGEIHAKFIMENGLTLEEYLYANFEF